MIWCLYPTIIGSPTSFVVVIFSCESCKFFVKIHRCFLKVLNIKLQEILTHFTHQKFVVYQLYVKTSLILDASDPYND